MEHRELHDGRSDGLNPLISLDLARVDSFAGLVRGMAQTAFGGRALGEALDVLHAMATDDDCRVVMTITGAMTVAKQGTIFCDLIERGVVDAVVATGALVAHGLTESIGLTHYRYDPSHDDEKLFEQGYNRIYDTLEMESNLNDVEVLVRTTLEETTPEDGVWSSARLCRAIGRKLDDLDHGRGILRSAYQQDVPVFIPAFTDSEMGLDVATWAMRKALADAEAEAAADDAAGLAEGDRSHLPADEVFSHVPPFNPFLDLLEYARLIGGAPTTGIFTIGGGVPRNWAQQVAPFYDITNHRVGTKLVPPRFKYGVRLCPEPVHWGGLSGCTYTEGVSWGKFVPPSEGGRFAEVPADATIALPLLAKALFEVLDG